MKKRVVIFGATDTGKRIYSEIKHEADVLFFVDEDKRKWGTKIDAVDVAAPERLRQAEYDCIYIGVLTYYREVLQLLEQMDIPKDKINGRYVEVPTFARIECLRSIREMLADDGIDTGAVAELGVYQGDFAKEINAVFPDRTLYLFDTFEGFHADDCSVEVDRGFMKSGRTGYFSNTSEEMVLEKMRCPEKCVICKGFFPQSAAGVEDCFCFVNLDADLYAPTLAGLEFFYPRMVDGGVILVHDYFSKAFLGAKEAVKEYCGTKKIGYVPIGDTLSIAIRKQTDGKEIRE